MHIIILSPFISMSLPIEAAKNRARTDIDTLQNCNICLFVKRNCKFFRSWHRLNHLLSSLTQSKQNANNLFDIFGELLECVAIVTRRHFSNQNRWKSKWCKNDHNLQSARCCDKCWGQVTSFVLIMLNTSCRIGRQSKWSEKSFNIDF